MNSRFFSEYEIYSEKLAKKHKVSNEPEEWNKKNLRILFEQVDKAREIWGKPIKCTNAFRGKVLNKKAGGVPNSAHQRGLACDLEMVAKNQDNFIRACIKGGVKVHTFIKYTEKNFIHIDMRFGDGDTPNLTRIKDSTHNYSEYKLE